jgi:hypothetical protein
MLHVLHQAGWHMDNSMNVRKKSSVKNKIKFKGFIFIHAAAVFCTNINYTVRVKK